MWEEKWRHNFTITYDFLKHPDVDWVFSFHQHESVTQIRRNLRTEIFQHDGHAVQHAVFKSIEN